MVYQDNCPKDLDFLVCVWGDSMEPRYKDGDMLMVSKRIAEIGEIGIFSVDGEGYVKKRGKASLISLNHAYPDVKLTADNRCFGTVIGILDPTWIAE